MNRIYLPYPMEVILKLLSWIVVIVIDVIQIILTPILRIGPKCYAVFALLAAVLCGFVHFSYFLDFGKTILLFVTFLVGFLTLLGAVHLVKYILVKIVRPPFANIVFESVAVSFKRPFAVKRNDRRLLKRLSIDQRTDSAAEESRNPPKTD